MVKKSNKSSQFSKSALTGMRIWRCAVVCLYLSVLRLPGNTNKSLRITYNLSKLIIAHIIYEWLNKFML